MKLGLLEFSTTACRHLAMSESPLSIASLSAFIMWGRRGLRNLVRIRNILRLVNCLFL